MSNFISRTNAERAARNPGVGLYGTRGSPEAVGQAQSALKQQFSAADQNSTRQYNSQQLRSQIPGEGGPNSISPTVRASYNTPPTPPSASERPSVLRQGDTLAGPSRQRDIGNGITRYDNPGQNPLYSNVGNVDPGFGVSNLGDTRSALTSFQRANEIRGQGGAGGRRDQNAFMAGASGGIGGGGSSVADQIAELDKARAWEKFGVRPGQMTFRDRGYEAQRAGLVDQLKNDTELRGQDAAMQRVMAQGQFGLQEQGVRNQGAMNVAAFEGANRLEDTRLRGQFGLDEREKANEGALAVAQTGANQRSMSSIVKAVEAIRSNYNDPAAADLAVEQFLASIRPPETEMANGGLVGRPQYGQTPQASAVLPEVNEYREYSMGAKSLGLPPVPFEQFLAMRTGAKQVAGAQQQGGAMAFANGGEIPDPNAVAGKMVLDTDPNAPTDSIPAMIDGQTPAKLDSGEFVIPADVVKFFGTDKLNKMIAAARQGAQE